MKCPEIIKKAADEKLLNKKVKVQKKIRNFVIIDNPQEREVSSLVVGIGEEWWKRCYRRGQKLC